MVRAVADSVFLPTREHLRQAGDMVLPERARWSFPVRRIPGGFADAERLGWRVGAALVTVVGSVFAFSYAFTQTLLGTDPADLEHPW